MKKIITIVIALAIIVSGIFAIYTTSKPEEPTLQEKIDSKITAYYTELEDSLVTLTDKDNCVNYLLHWASTKDINSTTDEYNNVIYTRKSSKAYKDAPPTVIICQYNSADMAKSLNALSSAMYISKNKEGTGALTVIFTDVNDKTDLSETIDEKYFANNAKVFTLSSGETTATINQSAARARYSFSSDVKYTKTKFNKAYRLTIKGSSIKAEGSNLESPNPVKQLGDLLATFKTKALIFELAKFKGGTSPYRVPKSAECVIVVNENDCNKFQSQINSAKGHYLKKYESTFEDIDFTIEEVKTPKKVLTGKSTDKFISSLYTLIDGNHYDSDYSTSSVTTIGKVTITRNKVVISASGCSLSDDTLLEINDSYNTICSLSGMDYKLISQRDSWSFDSESDFSKELLKAYQQYTGSDLVYDSSLKPLPASQIALLTDENSVVEMIIGNEDIKDYTGCIIQYMINQLPEEEE